jgi:hypothetical protein
VSTALAARVTDDPAGTSAASTASCDHEGREIGTKHRGGPTTTAATLGDQSVSVPTLASGICTVSAAACSTPDEPADPACLADSNREDVAWVDLDLDQHLGGCASGAPIGPGGTAARSSLTPVGHDGDDGDAFWHGERLVCAGIAVRGRERGR